jgi:hypothetical protein
MSRHRGVTARNHFKRKEFASTDTLDSDIAALASTGESDQLVHA